MLTKVCVAAILGLNISTSAVGGESQCEGMLLQALIANAEGECPAAVLDDKMKTACEMQQPGIKKLLVKLGPLKSVEFEGIVSGTYTRHSEKYKVSFEHGDWIWFVEPGCDNKIHWANAPFQPEWTTQAHR